MQYTLTHYTLLIVTTNW